MCSYTRGVRTARNIGARHCPIKGPRCQGQGGAACAPTRSARRPPRRERPRTEKLSFPRGCLPSVTALTRVSRPRTRATPPAAKTRAFALGSRVAAGPGISRRSARDFRTGGQTMRRIVTWSVPLALAAAATAGCATKGWVNDVFGQKQAQMDERFARVDGAVREVGDASRVAQGRADAAFGRADDVNGRLTRLWTGRNKRTVVETLHVQFGI